MVFIALVLMYTYYSKDSKYRVSNCGYLIALLEVVQAHSRVHCWKKLTSFGWTTQEEEC